MKNLTILKTPAEVENYVHKLWSTELFKTAQKESPYLSKLIADFAALPRFFADMTDKHIERSNFTPWFNLVMHRDYDNPYVQDLYYLHEMIHATTLTYSEESWALWREKMFNNEMITSLETEVNVYQQLPELRPNSFSFPIWADSVLSSGPKSMEELISLRKHATLNPKSPAEELIRSYAQNNEVWALIWKDNYLEVETLMINFYQELKTKSLDEAISNYQKNLAKFSTDGIPWKKEAEAFAKIYWKK